MIHVARWPGALKRLMYRGGRPNALTRAMNRLDALTYASRWLPLPQGAVLQVVGRRSGALTSVPVAVARHDGGEYLVSMLGPEANWVRNVRAAGGRAVLRRRGRAAPVRLAEVPVERRAEILRRYAAVAPGARPHLGLGPKAPLDRFRRIAAGHPVFRILRADGSAPDGHGSGQG
ncbi:nitroreductase family deazaflavin-dependent oxidoreductase [Nonomuraea sp. NPDC050227]|uniref:nitroreductase family deazaflavin-dependent oxidoreductase n=1 Tax=Nonomuraea sp. NPDC050227 TaxID=3364360 RepID=UPI003789F65E